MRQIMYMYRKCGLQYTCISSKSAARTGKQRNLIREKNWLKNLGNGKFPTKFLTSCHNIYKTWKEVCDVPRQW